MDRLTRMDPGLGLLMSLNWDRMLSVLAVVLSLCAGVWIASL